ncbi:MAG: peptidylprolyl isomerase [Candidatus Zixiibacteriota bacterium]|nr:MAG: peptidylprolyl isomerase [candidate division Zixibacteria bacterium]
MINRSLFVFVIAIVSLAVLISGCKVSTLTRDDIVASDFPVALIDSTGAVMASALYYRLAVSDLVEEGGILDSSTYFDTLNAIILDSIISMEAKEVNLRDDPPVYRTYLFRYQNFYIDYIFQHLILDSIDSDSLSIDSFYRAHPELFAYKEQVNASHIVISAEGLKYGHDSVQYKAYTDEQLDSIARQKIYNLRAQIDSGVDFGYLANEYSVHRESGKKDGRLGYFFRNTYNKEFEDQAFSLPEGSVSQPFKSPDGWHIIKIDDHVDSGLAVLTPQLYENAKEVYIKSVAGPRSRDFMDSIMGVAQIVYNDSALSANIHEAPETLWAATVNDIDTITFFRFPDYLHQFKLSKNIDTVTLDVMHETLDFMSSRLVLIQAADELGFGSDSAVVATREALYHKYAIEVVKKRGRDPDFVPSDSLIEDYYQKHIDRYVIQKPVRVQHIIVDDSVFGEFLRDQALSGVDFLDLAKEYYPGAEEIRTAAADLGWIGPGEMPERFYEHALATPVKGISHPVKTEWGYHIIKVLDRQYNKTVQQARPSIIDAVKREHQYSFHLQWKRDMVSRYRIDYNLDRIKRLELASKQRR